MKSILIITSILSAISLVSCTHECTCVMKVDGNEVYKETVQHKGRCKELNKKINLYNVVREYTCERE